jgi:hypothetical protein
MIASSFKYSFRFAVAQPFVKVASCQVVLLLQLSVSSHVGSNSHACPSVRVKDLGVIIQSLKKSAAG